MTRYHLDVGQIDPAAHFTGPYCQRSIDGYVCTLPRDHGGDFHVAHYPDGQICAIGFKTARELLADIPVEMQVEEGL